MRSGRCSEVHSRGETAGADGGGEEEGQPAGADREEVLQSDRGREEVGDGELLAVDEVPGPVCRLWGCDQRPGERHQGPRQPGVGPGRAPPPVPPDQTTDLPSGGGDVPPVRGRQNANQLLPTQLKTPKFTEVTTALFDQFPE